MQNFAIAGGVINGDPKVWIGDALARVEVSAAGDGMRGAVAGGAAQVELSADLPLAMRTKLSGAASIAMSGQGGLLRGAALIGNAAVRMDASGDFTRWAMLEGLAPIEVDAEGDILVVEGIGATFTMQVGASGDIHVARSRGIEGHARISASASLAAWSAPATPLEGLAPIEVAGIGRGALRIMSPPGMAAMSVLAYGDMRMGAKVPLAGSAVVELYARGEAGKFRYVFLDGLAAVEIAAHAEKVGVPSFPGYYIEVPASRALRVNAEMRRFIVPAERRV